MSTEIFCGIHAQKKINEKKVNFLSIQEIRFRYKVQKMSKYFVIQKSHFLKSKGVVLGLRSTHGKTLTMNLI